MFTDYEILGGIVGIGKYSSSLALAKAASTSSERPSALRA